MPLSWYKIKTRAAVFIKEWGNETNEDAEKNLSGVTQRQLKAKTCKNGNLTCWRN